MIRILLLALAIGIFRSVASVCTESDKSLWYQNEEFTKEYLSIAQFSGGIKTLARSKFKDRFSLMSEECRECHVNMIACGARHCLTKCGKPKSEDCHSCVTRYCMEPYMECLGYRNIDDLPIPAHKLTR